MSQAEIVITALLVAVVGLSALARALSASYPIMLVVGGAVLGFVPGLPEVRLNPAIVLVVFLPPLLYGSAIYANVNDFRADLRWLALNTVPLVLVTMGVVAVVARTHPRPAVGCCLRARSDRLTHRPAGHRDDHAPPRCSAAHRQRRRGRRPVQRCHRARRASGVIAAVTAGIYLGIRAPQPV
jgi:NhaP-type Na+/H+ or K+/H+ antiporter